MLKIRYSIHSFLVITLLLFSCDGKNNPDIDREDDSTADDTEVLSEYITEVFEYVYAPGQHAQIVEKRDAENLIGEPSSELLLGGFGGYVIAGFDHDIKNIPNVYDFEIFSAGVTPEPAIVYVMSDENSDGLPNETWYELKGNLIDHENTIRNYSVTYFKPQTETENVKWTDNMGNSGELLETFNKGRSSYHWWWNETKENQITFTGTKLPDAYINDSGSSQSEHWVVPEDFFKWGYAENNYGSDYDKESRSNRFDISNAIDKNGNPVYLAHIRFVKIQTGVFQQTGWLNEISSEIRGARDLNYHPE